MKKGYLLLLLLLFCICIPVHAVHYDTYVLIPVDTPATVKTDAFTYNEFVYQSAPNEKGNCAVVFQSIQNLTQFKKPISINLLLFDGNRQNIGFLTYCTDKDVSSDYNGYKLAGGEAAPFSINVTTRYFIEGKKPTDVMYVAVLDDNEYCQIGGYTKYQGLTIQEIYGGNVVSTSKQGYHFRDILQFFKDADTQVIIITAVIVFFIAIAYGLVVNAFHKKLFLKYSAWAYVPVINAYIAMKMIWGETVAAYFTGAHILSIILFFFNINFFIMVCLAVIGIVFLIIVFKLLTKRYETLYYDPRIAEQQFSNDTYSTSDYYSNLDSKGNFANETSLADEYVVENDRDKVSSALAYTNQDIQNDFNFGEDDVREGSGTFNPSSSDMAKFNNQNDNNGESDLSNFFK